MPDKVVSTKAIEEGWRRFILPTYLENWPVELKALTVHQEGIELSVGNVLALGHSQVELYEYWQTRPITDEVRRERMGRLQSDLDATVRRVMAQAKSEGVFVRLGSRSPKDSYFWWRDERPEGQPEGRMWPIVSGAGAVGALLDTSERINDDLLEAVSLDYTPWIWVRAWVDILPFQEFRCFVKGGRVVGISQYNYAEMYPQLVKDKTLYINAVQLILNKRIIPSLHIPDAVVDVYVTLDTMPSGRGRRASARLLEINPYFELTDPCLFGWDEIRKLEEQDLPTEVRIREGG